MCMYVETLHLCKNVLTRERFSRQGFVSRMVREHVYSYITTEGITLRMTIHRNEVYSGVYTYICMHFGAEG